MDLLEFASRLAWPGAVLGGAYMFRDPLSDFLETIGQRARAIQAYHVRIELGQLTDSVMPAIVIEQLASGPPFPSNVTGIAASIRTAASVDCTVIDVGTPEKRTWLTSRLFLLAAIIERVRPTRCLAFVGESSITGGRFIGAATPRDVRHTLGVRCSAYERALAAAFVSLFSGIPRASEEFQGGLSNELIDLLLSGFFGDTEVVTSTPNPVPAARWVSFGTPPTVYEHAEWVSAALLTDMLAGRLSTGTVPAAELSRRATVKTVIAHRGPFVATVGADRKFAGLIDRYRVLEQVSAELVGSIEDDRPRRRDRPGSAHRSRQR